MKNAFGFEVGREVCWPNRESPYLFLLSSK